MSISVFTQGGLQQPEPVRLADTLLTDVFTAKDNSPTIGSWSLANETASPVQVNCYYSDGTTDFLEWSGSIPANESVNVTGQPLRLREGDKFKVQATTGNAITVSPKVTRVMPNAPART